MIGEPTSGVGYARFVQPFEHLGERGFELRTLGARLALERHGDGVAPAPSLLDGIDLILFPQSIASPTLPDGTQVDLVGAVCDEAERRGIPVVYSVDDSLDDIEAENPAFERVRDSIGNRRRLLDQAAALFVTTPPLRERLAASGKPVHLLPNAIDPARWRPRPRDSGEFRIGWAGSASHLPDLLMVLPALRRLQARLDFHFVLQGLVHRPIEAEVAQVRRLLPGLGPSERATADAFLELAGGLAALRHTHVPFASIGDYIELLPRLDLDVGICPLLDTPFNRHKSALKFYEYAACGTLTVASAVTPYREEVSLICENEADAWCELLLALAGDDTRRQRELERQREFVLRERDIRVLRDRWADALRAALQPVRATCEETAR